LEAPDQDADPIDKIIHRFLKMILAPIAKVFGVDLFNDKEAEEGEKKRMGPIKIRMRNRQKTQRNRKTQ